MVKKTSGIDWLKPYNHERLPDHFLGGNSLAVAAPSEVKDFVEARNGHTVITSVLIANNGIAAVKEIRSVRKWAYQTFGDERAITFTVMATPEDMEGNADYIRMADQVVNVPGGTNNNNHANVDLIVDIAERANVHAVWAGWGHASENPLLPEKLAASPKKIVFIGPPASAMRSLGDKISSTIVAQHAKVPCIPWSGTGVDDVRLDEESGLVSVDESVYAKGCSRDAQDGLAKAEIIGLPVMIKASEGGGGKGIRKVDEINQFVPLYKQVEAEVPGSPIFIMKLASAARHLEVQLLADQYGNNISLFGRDCSVQRRHQKIIEEAPVDIAPQETFREMEKSAVRLGKLVGYVSAGTVEYLYSHEDDKFFFLELNPRLQVEHPTTEMVTGVNLPAAQLQIAMGIPLDYITDIRMFYNADPLSKRRIDFNFEYPQESSPYQSRPVPKGHTTACRITSEDPGEGFKPSSGSVSELNFRSSSNVWGYFSVGNQGNIHSYSDSQFGHIFAFGETREASRRSMVVALKELSIRGDFRTTVEYLVKLLETKDFEKNTITTGWLDTLISKKLTTERPDKFVAVLCGAVVKSHIEIVAATNNYKEALLRGQIPSKSAIKFLFQVDFIYEGEHFRFTATRSSKENFNLFLNGARIDVSARSLSDGGLLVGIDGKSHIVYWNDDVAGLRISVDSKTCLLEQENDPTQLRTPSPGRLIRYLVESGEHIDAGTSYAEVEVMKMYLPLVSSESGIMQPLKQPGASLDAGDIIGIIALDDPTKVKRAQPFTGTVPEFGSSQVVGNKLDTQYAKHISVMENIMRGYDNQVVMSAEFRDLISTLRDPELPYAQWSQRASALHSRLPASLDHTLSDLVTKSHQREHEFPSKQILKALAKYAPESVADRTIWESTFEPLYKTAQDFKDGLEAHEYKIIANIIDLYYETEKQFMGREETAVLRLRDLYKDDLDRVVELVMSHSRVGSKNNLLLLALQEYESEKANKGMIAEHLRPALRRITELDSRATAKAVLKARELIIKCALPSLKEQTEQMEHILRSSVTGSVFGGSLNKQRRTPDLSILTELVDTRYSVYDVLFQFFRHIDPYVVLAASEVYIRRINRAYDIDNLEYHTNGIPALTYDFELKETSSFSTLVNDGLQTPASQYTLSNRGLLRHGIVLPGDIDDIDDAIHHALTLIPKSHRTRPRALSNPTPVGSTPDKASEDLMNTCNIIVFEKNSSTADDDEALVMNFQDTVLSYQNELINAGIRRLTVLVQIGVGNSSKYFTFQGPDYRENKTLRHVNPPLAYQLELNRLSNFNIHPVFTENRYIHVYEAVAKNDSADKRYFVRAVVTPERVEDEISTPEYLTSESNKLLNEILDSLQVLDMTGSDLNHLFINFAAVFTLSPLEIQEAFGGFLERFGRRLWRLRVTDGEIRIVITDSSSGETYPLRAMIHNASGFVVTTDLYTEVRTDKGELVYKSIGKPGNMHLRPVLTPYPPKEWLQMRRYEANLKGTTYVYDFPELFAEATAKEWVRFGGFEKVPSSPLFTYNELFLDESGEKLAEVARDPGGNNIGMVAWKCTAKTPEYPSGRQFIIVANDMTFKIGSFGPIEDKLFNKVTELARELGIPRIYLSANSGARLGLAEELIPVFNVAWNDPSDQEKGFQYLYLTPEEYEQHAKQDKPSVHCSPVKHNGEIRHKIEYVIGQEDGIGVECLKGSAMIAGETARAYKDIFTITLVSCRSVGIGAYLVRLGQRAIQIEGKPLLLTGADAINKILNREVYTSNQQLGGTQIMYSNGISHLVASNDYQGVEQIMEWLCYIPNKRNEPVPIVSNGDHWDRTVDFRPVRDKAYDARWLISGRESDEGYESGLFDRNSFIETLSGWAKGVIVGRAKLGGVPFGVIAVDARATETVIPADPANPLSTEAVIPEAGQVWFPNSAFKTAQAIYDFNRGEQLPLMVLANWRGFSGGQRDMFFEILKYGSYIVDALTEYKQPIFVYIPPTGELRGGAWVVIDPTINTAMMESYADYDTYGGILEPEGLVSVKFRKRKLLQLMKRLDSEYASLLDQLESVGDSREEMDELRAKIEIREKKLLPMYEQISIKFAYLHDNPGRMQAKDCIRSVIPWEESRRFFYWRSRRRLQEVYAARKIQTIRPELSDLDAQTMARSIYEPHLKSNDDREVTEWLESNSLVVDTFLNGLRANNISRALSSASRNSGVLEKAVEGLSQDEKKKLLEALNKL